MLIAAVLFATVLLRFGLVLAVVYVLIPKGPACPRCGAMPARVRHPVLRWILPSLEHSWCLDCGWNGLVRRRPQSRVISRAARS